LSLGCGGQPNRLPCPEVQPSSQNICRWFHLHALRGLPRGSCELRAELTVDGYLLVIDGPPLES
jgi:hypothetical protein